MSINPKLLRLNLLNEKAYNEIYKTYAMGRKNFGVIAHDQLRHWYPHAFIWYDEKSNPVSGILYYESNFGKKIGASFTIDKNHYKAHVVPFYARLLKSKTNHYYAEVSNAIEHLLSKQNGIRNVLINKRKHLEEILKNTTIQMQNEGWYVRRIESLGENKRKRMYGNPKLKYDLPL